MLYFTLHVVNSSPGFTLYGTETHAVHLMITAKAEGEWIHRDFVLLECMQSSLKVGVLKILMPNVSHPSAWSGPYQNSSVFPGCLGLDLISTGTHFVYGVVLTAEKPHLECGLCVSHFGGRPVYLSVWVGDTTGC